MLDVIFILAAIEQLHTGRQMFRLVPGVSIDAPGTGCQQHGSADHEHEGEPQDHGAV